MAILMGKFVISNSRPFVLLLFAPPLANEAQSEGGPSTARRDSYRSRAGQARRGAGSARELLGDRWEPA